MKGITVAQARAIDRDAVERLGMPSILLMENASAAVAAAARDLAVERGVPQQFVVLCGPGNNGGDGLAAARHLGRGAQVHLLAEPDPARSPDAALQLDILRRAGWTISSQLPEAGAAGVWIDALFGTGLTRALEGAAAEWASACCAEPSRPVLAVDVPSGLNGDTGAAPGPTVVADVTVTFAAPKVGLLAESARSRVGRIVVAGLGIPPDVVGD